MHRRIHKHHTNFTRAVLALAEAANSAAEGSGPGEINQPYPPLRLVRPVREEN